MTISVWSEAFMQIRAGSARLPGDTASDIARGIEPMGIQTLGRTCRPRHGRQK